MTHALTSLSDSTFPRTRHS